MADWHHDAEAVIKKMLTAQTRTNQRDVEDAKRELFGIVEKAIFDARRHERSIERSYMIDWLDRRESLKMAIDPRYWKALLADVLRGAHNPHKEG